MKLSINTVFLGALMFFPIVSAFVASNQQEFLATNTAFALYIIAYTLIIIRGDSNWVEA